MDGKQHLSLGDKMGADGIKRMLSSAGVGAGSSKTPKKRKGENGKGKGKDGEAAKPKEAQFLHLFSSITGNSMQGKRVTATYFHHPCFYGACFTIHHCTAQVVPETPLDKAATLLATVMKEANSCRIPGCINHIRPSCNIT